MLQGVAMRPKNPKFYLSTKRDFLPIMTKISTGSTLPSTERRKRNRFITNLMGASPLAPFLSNARLPVAFLQRARGMARAKAKNQLQKYLLPSPVGEGTGVRRLSGGGMMFRVLLISVMLTSCPVLTTQTATRRVLSWPQTCCSCSTAIRPWCGRSSKPSRGCKRSSMSAMRTWDRRWRVPYRALGRRRRSMQDRYPVRPCSKPSRRPRARRIRRS